MEEYANFHEPENQHCKDVSLLKLIYRLNAMSIKIPAVNFVKNCQGNSKFYVKIQRVKNCPPQIVRRFKFRELKLPDTQTYSKALVKKMNKV